MTTQDLAALAKGLAPLLQTLIRGEMAQLIREEVAKLPPAPAGKDGADGMTLDDAESGPDRDRLGAAAERRRRGRKSFALPDSV